MKQVLAVLLLVPLFLSCALPVHSAENAVTKLGRGICNIVTCPVEIGEQSERIRKSNGSFDGMTFGIFKGLACMVRRAVVGVYEVATFPIPYPNQYGPILTDPVSLFPEIQKKAPPPPLNESVTPVVPNA